MPAVLRLHRVGGVLAGLEIAHRVRKRLHHVIEREPSEIATVGLRGVHRLRLGEVLELLALLQAVDDFLREWLRRDEDVPGVVLRLRQLRHLSVVLGLQLIVGRLLVSEHLLRERLLEDVQPLHLDELCRLRLLVQALLLRLFGQQLRPDQVVEGLRALLRREIARSLAGDPLDVELVGVAADRRAVDGRNRWGRCGGGRAALARRA